MPDTVFSRVKLGGGGFVCHIDISPDGATRLIKTDVFGAYIWADPSNRALTDTSGVDTDFEWMQLITRDSMPSDENSIPYGGGHGCFEVGSAPSNPNRIYAVFIPNGGTEAFYVSDNRGATWTRKAIPAGDYHTADTGGSWRNQGRKFAIDPVDESAVYLFSNDGELHYTRNDGDSWTTVSSSEIPEGSPGHIAIDESSTTTGGLKTRVYAATGENGLYVSNDSGVNWTAVTDSPLETVSCLRCDALGRVWMTVAAEQGSISNNCWRYASSTWTNLSPSLGVGFQSVNVNPLNTAEVAAQYQAGQFAFSADNGATWSAVAAGTVPPRVVTDIPWMSETNEDYMSAGIGMYDPVTDGRYWFPMGIGVYYTDEVPTTAAFPTWVELTRGNDELIPDRLVKPPGRPLFAACQDRAIFRFDDVNEYPADHGPFMDVPIRHGWSVDYAKNDPDFIACIANGGNTDGSSYSEDGGDTWTLFGDLPASVDPGGTVGGALAVSTPSSMCWFTSQNGLPYYTDDGGDTWSTCTFPGDVATTGSLGWSFSQYTLRIPVWADKVTAETFYAYCYGGSATVPADAEGFYRSTDGGANWTRRGVGPTVAIGQQGSSTMGECVPGEAGHFFWTMGRTGGGPSHPYNPIEEYKVCIFSDDGGTTSYQVDGFTEAWVVSFGMAAPGHDYPAIFVAGQQTGDSDPGIYRCDDWDATTRTGTWERLGDGDTAIEAISIDNIFTIAGDMDEYGTVYAGLGGSGVIMGSFQYTASSAGLRFRIHT